MGRRLINLEGGNRGPAWAQQCGALELWRFESRGQSAAVERNQSKLKVDQLVRASVCSTLARAKKLSRAAESLVYSLTPSGVLAENHPKNRGFVGILRGQKCLKRDQKCLKKRFSRRSPVGEWSRGAHPMPRVFGRGSRSQPAALVSDRDDAALFPQEPPPAQPPRLNGPPTISPDKPPAKPSPGRPIYEPQMMEEVRLLIRRLG
jgi:hypothetical protein